MSATGNHAGEADLPGATTTAAWFFLSRVEVVAPQQAGAIVAFGDSITDGTRSTVNTNNRWPDHLAKRLQAQKINLGVLNQGIAGNRVLGDGAGVSALARFDRDVLAQAGATHVIVLESINDIGLARDNACPSAADIIAAHRQLIERAHARGLKIFGAHPDAVRGRRLLDARKARRSVRRSTTGSGPARSTTASIDFDAAVRDPERADEAAAAVQPGRQPAPDRRGVPGDGQCRSTWRCSRRSRRSADLRRRERRCVSRLLCAGVVGCLVGLMVTVMAQNTRPSSSSFGDRFKPLTYETMTPEQKRMTDNILNSERKSMGGPFNALLRSPEMGDLAQQLGAYVRFRSSLPRHLNEMAIIMTARVWTAQYEWYVHKQAGARGGPEPGDRRRRLPRTSVRRR